MRQRVEVDPVVFSLASALPYYYFCIPSHVHVHAYYLPLIFVCLLTCHSSLFWCLG